MSNLLKKFAKLSGKPVKKDLRKKGSMMDVNVVGYRAENEEGIIFYLDKNTSDDLKQKIFDNSLSDAERNFLIGTVCDYYCSQVAKDDHLSEFTLKRPIIDYFELGDTAIVDEEILNMDLIDKECFSKKKDKETGERVSQFNKNKLRKMSPAEAVKLVTDPALVFEGWADAYYSRTSDIQNFITVDGLENELDHHEMDEDGNMIWGPDVRKMEKEKASEEVEASVKTDDEGGCCGGKCGKSTFTRTRSFKRKTLIRNDK